MTLPPILVVNYQGGFSSSSSSSISKLCSTIPPPPFKQNISSALSQTSYQLPLKPPQCNILYPHFCILFPPPPQSQQIASKKLSKIMKSCKNVKLIYWNLYPLLYNLINVYHVIACLMLQCNLLPPIDSLNHKHCLNRSEQSGWTMPLPLIESCNCLSCPCTSSKMQLVVLALSSFILK